MCDNMKEYIITLHEIKVFNFYYFIKQNKTKKN